MTWYANTFRKELRKLDCACSIFNKRVRASRELDHDSATIPPCTESLELKERIKERWRSPWKSVKVNCLCTFLPSRTIRNRIARTISIHFVDFSFRTKQRYWPNLAAILVMEILHTNLFQLCWEHSLLIYRSFDREQGLLTRSRQQELDWSRSYSSGLCKGFLNNVVP